MILPIPELTPVESSQIAALGYMRDSQTLYVQFKSGAVYAYAAVTQAAYESFLTAESIGRHFNAQFKANPRHPYTKLQDAAPPAPTIVDPLTTGSLDTALRWIHELEDQAKTATAKAAALREQVRATILQASGGQTYRSDVATVTIPEYRKVTVDNPDALIGAFISSGQAKYIELMPEQVTIVEEHWALTDRFQADAKAGFVQSEHVTVETTYGAASIRFAKVVQA